MAPAEDKGGESSPRLLTPELLRRVASALVLIPLALFALWKGGMWFAGLALAAGLIMTVEWILMIGLMGSRRWTAVAGTILFVIAFAIGYSLEATPLWLSAVVLLAGLCGLAGLAGHRELRWFGIGIVWIWVPVICMVWLRGTEDGLIYVLWTFLVVWGTDIGAYFVGRSFGGRKLAPRYSPNKTWSGLYGGVALAVLAGVLLSGLLQLHRPGVMAMVSLFLAVISQAGDISESAAKRHFGVKDSGRWIPGHGGLMDRLDGILYAAPAMAVIRTVI